MRVRYFWIDDDDTLQKATQTRVEAAWEGKQPWNAGGATCDLRIVTVLTDDEFVPKIVFLTRVRLTDDGHITDESAREATIGWSLMRPQPGGISEATKPSESYSEVQYQLSGWPDAHNVRRQLATALDAPIDQVPSAHFGGPLVCSMQLQISLKQAYSYFRHMSEVQGPRLLNNTGEP